MDAPATRGRGGARGAGRGRGGVRAPRGGANAAPLASQMKQVLRLEEPKEMAILRRLSDLGASQIRSVYGKTGLLDQEVKVPHAVAAGEGYPVNEDFDGFISILDAENALSKREERVVRERALARREVRLPEARRRLSWGQLSGEERRVLELSQKEFNSFRASLGGQPATAGGGAQAPPVPENPGQEAV